MKPPQIEPSWGLAFGFFIAPIACVLNTYILNILLLKWHLRTFDEYLSIGFISLILTGPMGFLTTRLLEIWNKGDYGKARSMGIAVGLFSLVFWFWAWNKLELSHQWGKYTSISVFGALLLPLLWSLLFPLFAIFSRPPKK